MIMGKIPFLLGEISFNTYLKEKELEKQIFCCWFISPFGTEHWRRPQVIPAIAKPSRWWVAWKAQKDLLCLWACRGTAYCGELEHLFLLLVFHFKVLITSVKHNDFSCCFGCKIWISPLSPSSSLSWDSLVVILVAEVWDTANVLRLQTRGICAHYFAHILNQVIPNLFGVGLKKFLIFNCYLLFFYYY